MGTRVQMGRRDLPTTRDEANSPATSSVSEKRPGSDSSGPPHAEGAVVRQHQPYRAWDNLSPAVANAIPFVTRSARSPIVEEEGSDLWDNTAGGLQQDSGASSPRSFRSSTSSGCLTPGSPQPAAPPRPRHATLEGAVAFYPYPTEPFQLPPVQRRRVEMIRVFIGQLPYGVTDMQLHWLCYQFGNGAEVYFPERIYQSVQAARTPRLQQKGCVHVYCDPRHVTGLFAGLHERILVDDPGVWVAENAAQMEILRQHCAWLKTHADQRPSRMPYAALTAQYANVQPSEQPRLSRPAPTVPVQETVPTASPPLPRPSYLRGVGGDKKD